MMDHAIQVAFSPLEEHLRGHFIMLAAAQQQERLYPTLFLLYICKLRNVCCCTLELDETRFSIIFDFHISVCLVKLIPINHISNLVLHFLSF